MPHGPYEEGSTAKTIPAGRRSQPAAATAAAAGPHRRADPRRSSARTENKIHPLQVVVAPPAMTIQLLALTGWSSPFEPTASWRRVAMRLSLMRGEGGRTAGLRSVLEAGRYVRGEVTARTMRNNLGHLCCGRKE